MEKKENKENKAKITQESASKAYKVTCGTYKDRNEALQKAAEAKKAGVNIVLTVGQEGYSLLHAGGMTKAAAEAEKKAIEARKIKAEVFSQ